MKSIRGKLFISFCSLIIIICLVMGFLCFIETKQGMASFQEKLLSGDVKSEEELKDFAKDTLADVRNIFLIVVFVGIGVAIWIISILSKRITKPIVSMVDYANKVASLDMTENVSEDLLKRKDEIGNLGKAFQKITDNFRGLTSDVSNISQQVASSSEELTATIQQTATATEGIANTIEEMAKGASDQAKDTEEGSIQVSKLGELIKGSWANMADLNEITKDIVVLKDEGSGIVQDLVEKTDESNKASGEIYDVIINVDESVESIKNASEMIGQIAEQTNLLALNAAIEAARAGEYGQGFAVVAEEIRKLAEQSNEFADEIQGIIKDLAVRTEDAVNTMKGISQLTASQGESVGMTKKKFEGIALAIEKAREATEVLSESVQAMDKRKEEIIDIVQNLSAIAEENAASTEEASASVEEQTASMEEISSASDALSSLAEEMQGKVSMIKL